MTFDEDDGHPFKLHLEGTTMRNNNTSSTSMLDDFEWDDEHNLFSNKNDRISNEIDMFSDDFLVNNNIETEFGYETESSTLTDCSSMDPFFSQILPINENNDYSVPEILSDDENPLKSNSANPVLSSIVIPDSPSPRPYTCFLSDVLAKKEIKTEKIDNKTTIPSQDFSIKSIFEGLAKKGTAKNDIKMVVPLPPKPVATIPNIVTLKSSAGSLIRLPVKRVNGNIGNTPNTGLKAIVIGPNRSKSILCDVVRSSDKGVIIQKPVDQTWLNITGGIRTESSKLPMKVKIMTSKENCVPIKNLVNKNHLPIFIKQKTSSNLPTPTVTVNLSKPTLMPANNIKIETEELPTEISQSSDAVFDAHSSSSPFLNQYNGEMFAESCTPFITDEDDMSGDSYKCFPLAQVTGHQVQPPPIPDIFKYTPNSSPVSLEALDAELDSLFPPYTNYNNQFYNKAAADVHHDYGFTCRAPQSNISIASLFNVDSLGIQTPSASEPSLSEPSTDADDSELDDVYMNESFDCEKMEREQKEYFEALTRQLNSAKTSTKSTGTDLPSSGPITSETQKAAAKASSRKPAAQRKIAPATRRVSRKESPALKAAVAFAKSFNWNRTAANVSSPVKSPKKRAPPARVANNGAATKKKGGGTGRSFSLLERQQHNENEKDRRIHLKMNFERVRSLVPALAYKDRSAKVEVLTKAKLYLEQLRSDESDLMAQKSYLRARKQRLTDIRDRLREEVETRYAALRHY